MLVTNTFAPLLTFKKCTTKMGSMPVQVSKHRGFLWKQKMIQIFIFLGAGFILNRSDWIHGLEILGTFDGGFWMGRTGDGFASVV